MTVPIDPSQVLTPTLEQLEAARRENEILRIRVRAYENSWRIVREELGLSGESETGSDVIPRIRQLRMASESPEEKEHL